MFCNSSCSSLQSAIIEHPDAAALSLLKESPRGGGGGMHMVNQILLHGPSCRFSKWLGICRALVCQILSHLLATHSSCQSRLLEGDLTQILWLTAAAISARGLTVSQPTGSWQQELAYCIGPQPPNCGRNSLWELSQVQTKAALGFASGVANQNVPGRFYITVKALYRNTRTSLRGRTGSKGQRYFHSISMGCISLATHAAVVMSNDLDLCMRPDHRSWSQFTESLPGCRWFSSCARCLFALSPMHLL